MRHFTRKVIRQMARPLRCSSPSQISQIPQSHPPDGAPTSMSCLLFFCSKVVFAFALVLCLSQSRSPKSQKSSPRWRVLLKSGVCVCVGVVFQSVKISKIPKVISQMVRTLRCHVFVFFLLKSGVCFCVGVVFQSVKISKISKVISQMVRTLRCHVFFFFAQKWCLRLRWCCVTVNQDFQNPKSHLADGASTSMS